MVKTDKQVHTVQGKALHHFDEHITAPNPRLVFGRQTVNEKRCPSEHSAQGAKKNPDGLTSSGEIVLMVLDGF